MTKRDLTPSSFGTCFSLKATRKTTQPFPKIQVTSWFVWKFCLSIQFRSFTANRFLYSQVIVRRQKWPHQYKHRSKYVAKVKKVLTMGNHYAGTFVRGSWLYRVDPRHGLSFHYREKCLLHLCTRRDNINDLTARKFSPEIWNRVDKVCGQIFESGVCP